MTQKVLVETEKKDCDRSSAVTEAEALNAQRRNLATRRSTVCTAGRRET